MSSQVFPDLPGLKATRSRSATYRTEIFESLSGREQRVQLWSFPRYRWALSLDFARAASLGDPTGAVEADSILAFHQQHSGAADSFLFRDPDDATVAASMGFGIGDGATVAFQLQKLAPGASRTVFASGAIPTVRRKNLAKDLANADGLIGGTGVAPVVTQNAGVAPDGTATALRAFLNKGGGSTSPDYSCVRFGSGSKPVGDGFSYTGSVWLRTLSSTAAVRLVLGSATAAVTATTSWQRFSVTCPFAAGDSDATGLSVWTRGTWGTDDRAEMLCWGPQSEIGSSATAHFAPNATGTATSVPPYWPAVGPFEPVTEPGPDLEIATDGDGLGLRALRQYARTNLVTQSNTLSDAAWTKTRCTVTGSQAGAPDNTATAWLWQEDATASATHFLNHAMTWGAGTRCVSVYAKAKERTRFKLARASDSAGVIFDLSAGSIVSADSGWAGTIVACGSGWFRCSIVRTDAANSDTICPHMIGAGGTVSYSGDGTSGLYLWGFQGEMGGSPGDYLATTASTVSRTDYTVGNGLVTFAAAPRSGAQLLWSGSFYRRVRFERDDLSLERILAGLWGGGLQLISVK